jgi:hypothetical protein
MTEAINVLNSTKNLSILGRPKSVAQYTEQRAGSAARLVANGPTAVNRGPYLSGQGT